MRRNRGQALVEFALIFPILFFVLALSIDVFRVDWVSSTVAEAARQAARQAVANEDPSDNASTTMDKQDRRKVLQQCLAKLPPAQREVMELFYYQDEPIEAVARRTGVPLNTVKSRMFYARTRMAELLNEAGVDRAWLR